MKLTLVTTAVVDIECNLCYLAMNCKIIYRTLKGICTFLAATSGNGAWITVRNLIQ